MRTFINEMNLSQCWVDAIIEDFCDYDKVGDISISTLIKPPQAAVLESRHEDEVVEDVSDRLNAFLGGAVHYALKKACKDDSIMEERMVVEFAGVKVSLKADRVEPIPSTVPAEFHLKDFKVTTIWKVIFDEMEEYEQQGNCYAYFFRKIGVNVTRISFELMLKDWKYMEAKVKHDYPQKHIHVVSFRVWSDEECEAFLNERIKIHMASRLLPDEGLPPCSGDDRWLRDEKFKVMKKGAKRSTKNCDTKAEAEEYMEDHGYSSPTYSIVYKPGENTRCERYCTAKPFCRQYAIDINPEF